MASPTAVVRAAAPGDLAAVARVYAYYVHNTVATFDEVAPSPAEWEDKFDDLVARSLPFLVAELSGAVVGFAYASPWRPKPGYRHTVEDTIYLAPEAAGQGIGRALLGALIAAAARAGKRQMIAVVSESATGPSAKLHTRFGFTVAGHLAGVGFKHGRWIDTFLLQRALSADDGDR
ncbi:N-acetyltransferase family protein [Sinomonas sp. JGH33]|uniref:N-acetyltransferase family protein n=1 Tax=Sinomonas terricola TaxID=3110330 RepID=A0ABU5T2U8_9MICC|nr:GNAT family N-acetyltransferase [Sinomonas sp. JGH33]MEA5453992.1 N-acetyltransferase family protein [Sinomonas sp. JGH33]